MIAAKPSDILNTFGTFDNKLFDRKRNFPNSLEAILFEMECECQKDVQYCAVNTELHICISENVFWNEGDSYLLSEIPHKTEAILGHQLRHRDVQKEYRQFPPHYGECIHLFLDLAGSTLKLLHRIW